MEIIIKKPFLNALEMINESIKNGSFPNLTKIYNHYGRPKHMSPKKVIKREYCSQMITDEIQESGYRIEEVIRFEKRTVFANCLVAFAYLYCLDYESCESILPYALEIGGLEKLLCSINDDESEGGDYFDLPF